jgi:hypothetical protein
MPDRYGENEPNRSYPQGNPADFVAGRMVDACGLCNADGMDDTMTAPKVAQRCAQPQRWASVRRAWDRW